MAGRTRGRGGRGPAAIAAPFRPAVRRPRRGWVAGLLGEAVVVVVRLLALVLALIVLAGITAALWWAGDGRIPIVVLVYGFIGVAWGGFALGRSGRLLTWSFRRPEGPARRPWEPGTGHVRSGPRGRDDPVIAGPFGAAQQEECQ
jgi:hypothetical protein